MAESLYHIQFRENVEKKMLCQLSLSEQQVDQLREAIEELYYFEFVLDDIPIWGFVGYLEESGFLPHSHKVVLWTHLDFNIEYNGDSIIFANVSVKDVKPVPLEEGTGTGVGGVGLGGGGLTVTHTYSVHWFESPLPHSRRGERFRDYSFFPKTLEIHWLSIINSLVLVVLLLGFVIIILMRVLKNDFARYNVEEEGGCDDLDQGDNGWKIIHTDVFRFPPYRSLLCAILGVGAQFLTLATGIILMALLGMFNVHRHGAINSAAIALYALTSCVSGYVSCSFYTQINGQRWVWNIILTSSLFSAPLFLTWSVVNSVHWWSGSHRRFPPLLCCCCSGPGCWWAFLSLSSEESWGRTERATSRRLVELATSPDRSPHSPGTNRQQCTWPSGFSALQCHLRGAVLHLRHSLGQGALHAVRHPAVRFRHPHLRRRLHFRGPHLLPVVWRGLPLVVAKHPQHRLHGHFYFRLLRFLLQKPIVYEWPGPEYGVFRLLATHGNGFLSNAG
ncbi:hypothetical protein WMY93_030011 [Mugilogobius chulae]|uniref:Transmembrane 9 superfamily member n=1 Tax=Mugilogobius chulae TaxID=88201 RepID=A0AAW0MR24_9GOBI